VEITLTLALLVSVVIISHPDSAISKQYHQPTESILQGESMTAEQITTIITNLLTGTGVVCFLGMVIKGLKNQITGLKTQIGTLNETIEVQKKTLEAMETRVLETEKVGNIYKRLTEELPAEIDKYRNLITKMKDDQITELKKANQDKDERLQKTAQIEIDKLELQQRALDDIPQLRTELIQVVSTLQQRLSVVDLLDHELMQGFERRKRQRSIDVPTSASISVQTLLPGSDFKINRGEPNILHIEND
jgi:DNA repair exonuclease SbcCD ATPase subunit